MSNLVTMNQFILMMEKPKSNVNDYYRAVIDNIFNYAEFLNQKLKIGMFIPADENDNILQEPSIEEMEKFKGLKYGDFDMDYTKVFNYLEAKERVLFENCSVKKVNDFFIVNNGNSNIWYSFSERKIEELANYFNLKLSKHAESLIVNNIYKTTVNGISLFTNYHVQTKEDLINSFKDFPNIKP